MRKGIVSVLLLIFAAPALASGTQDVLRDTAAMAAREQARAITSISERHVEAAPTAEKARSGDAASKSKTSPEGAGKTSGGETAKPTGESGR